MKKKQSEFPIKSIKEIKLTQNEMTQLKKEFPAKFNSQEVEEMKTYNDVDESINHKKSCNTYQASTNQISEMKKCCKFSDYVIDPNKHRYKVVIRVLALVIRFVNNLKLARENKLRGSKRIENASKSRKD